MKFQKTFRLCKYERPMKRPAQISSQNSGESWSDYATSEMAYVINLLKALDGHRSNYWRLAR